MEYSAINSGGGTKWLGLFSADVFKLSEFLCISIVQMVYLQT